MSSLLAFVLWFHQKSVKLVIYIILAYASLAQPLNRRVVSNVKGPEATVEPRPWTLGLSLVTCLVRISVMGCFQVTTSRVINILQKNKTRIVS